MAHPADLPRRIAGDQRMRGNIVGDDRSGGDEAVASQAVSADDGGVRTDRRAAADDGGTEFVFALDIGARIVHVGEDAGRSAENVVPENDALIETYIVLDLAAVPYPDIGPDRHVLADDATAADLRSLENVAEMPDLRSLADFAAVVDPGGFMGEIWSATAVPFRRRRTAGLHRPAGSIEDAQHADPVARIRPGTPSLTQAFEKMRALRL